MNQATKQEQLQPIYPQYISAPYVEDEISLVDLWIELVRYQKVFWAVFAVVLVLGLTAALTTYSERFNLVSAIEMGSIGGNGGIKLVESAESMQSKLTNVLVPKVTVEFLRDHPDLDKFKTTVSKAKGSDIVLIQNKVKESEVEAFTEFQTLLAGQLVSDHDRKLAFYQADLLAGLRAAKAKLAQLQDPETLKSRLDKQLIARESSQSKLGHLQKSYELLERGGQDLILTALSDEERTLMTRDGRVDDQLLRVRHKEVLLNNRIQQDDLKRSLASIEVAISDLKRDFQTEVEQRQREVEGIQTKLDTFNRTRVISHPVLSLKPEGMTRKLLIVLVVFGAGFAGFAAMLVAMFRDKVNQRRQELA